MNDISVYYQVYDNKNLTTKILSSFRKIYTDVHIRLLCDKGSDHTELSKEMNCEYVYSNYHMGLWGWNHKDVVSGKHCYGWTKEEGLEHISRWYNFAKSVKSKYILMMEDDIYVTKEISIINNDFVFTEVKPGNQLSDSIKNICNRFNQNHTLNRYGCCGGHFINRELYIDSVDKCLSFIDCSYDEMLSIDHHLGWPDTLNNLVFNLCEYVGIENTDYHEGFTNPENKAIFHDYTGRKEKWETLYNNVEK